MTDSKNTSPAKPSPSKRHHYLCSIKVRTGEQEYVVYELTFSDDKPFTQEDYWRQTLEFCEEGRELNEHDFEKLLAKMLDRDYFEAWPYDDRIYLDPWVQEITEDEYDVLRRYLYCR